MTTTAELRPWGLPDDDSWPRAGAWLSRPDDGGQVDLAVMGVPTHRTSLSSTGADHTPSAVRTALWRYSSHAASRGADLRDLSCADVGDVHDPDGDPEAARVALTGVVARSRLLVALGGDNAMTVPVGLAGMSHDLSRAGMVTLDAHHDLRDGRSNGSPVRELVDAGLDPTRIVQVGIADFGNSAEYAERARAWGIRVITVDDVRRRGITAIVRDALDIAGRAGGPVHVDLDVDVCDRAVAPGCPASLPGGLAAHELREAAYLAGLNSQVRSVGIAEVDATADAPDQRTVRLAALCVLEAAAGLVRRAPALGT